MSGGFLGSVRLFPTDVAYSAVSKNAQFWSLLAKTEEAERNCPKTPPQAVLFSASCVVCGVVSFTLPALLFSGYRAAVGGAYQSATTRS